MSAIFTRGNKVSNFLKKEFWPDVFHCRKNVTLTIAGLGRTDGPGEVVQLSAGKYVVLDADVGAAGVGAGVGTDVLAIIVDSEIDNKILAATEAAETDITVAVLYRGPCEIRKGGLQLTPDTDAADVYAILEAQGFTLADNFSVSNQTLPI